MDGDPADRGAGQFEHALPPFENLGLGMMLDRLGRRREESAERDIVRPRLARFHGKVPARVTRHADLRLRSQQAARVSGIAIVLPQMHAIGAQPLRERSEEHTSELQSLMRTSYAVFCLNKKNPTLHTNDN